MERSLSSALVSPAAGNASSSAEKSLMVSLRWYERGVVVRCYVCGLAHGSHVWYILPRGYPTTKRVRRHSFMLFIRFNSHLSTTTTQHHGLSD
jgi:hypothetical protein